ncbi:hypothetical protein N0V90_002556 [Kalmusia sp. IMI 367209]|nr:hypothetical protein N0V90_002556 [Kalmusia sp. IMI 367209]
MWAGVNVPNADATRWCETTLKFRLNDKKRLWIREIGTRMLATYNLDEGTKAQWKLTYYVPGSGEADSGQLVDTINVKGPVHTGNHEIPLDATLAPGTKPYNFTQCGGEVTVKYRTDLTVTEDVKGAVGEVNSMKAYYEHEYYNGTYYFGVEQGETLSYDAFLYFWLVSSEWQRSN